MVATPSNTRFQTSAASTFGAAVISLLPIPDRTAPHAVNLVALPNEPEDASLTGGTRSLDRRLTALNLSGSLARFGAAAERPGTSRRPAL